MDKKAQVEQLTTYMANFVSYIGKVLPDDIKAKINELAEKEDSPLSKVIYLSDNAEEPGSCKRAEQTKLSGHRSITVLGKMRNKLPTHWRTGSTLKGSSCKGYI